MYLYKRNLLFSVRKNVQPNARSQPHCRLRSEMQAMSISHSRSKQRQVQKESGHMNFYNYVYIDKTMRVCFMIIVIIFCFVFVSFVYFSHSYAQFLRTSLMPYNTRFGLHSNRKPHLNLVDAHTVRISYLFVSFMRYISTSSFWFIQRSLRMSASSNACILVQWNPKPKPVEKSTSNWTFH